MGIPDAFDTMYNKADAGGSTDGGVGSVFTSHSCYMASLQQVAGRSFSFGFCCGWYSCLSCLLVIAGLVKGMGLLLSWCILCPFSCSWQLFPLCCPIPSPALSYSADLAGR